MLWATLAGAASDAKGYATGELSLGDEKAPVTVIEYASMTCPHCATFHTETFKALKEKYVDTGKVHFVFREFPFDGLALRASMLARCSGEGRYFAMLDVLFRQQQGWSRSKTPLAELAKIGRLAGVSQAQFDACMADEALANVVIKNRMVGEKEHEVSSTPSFVVNGEVFSGSKTLAQFDEILAKHLR
ncbi:MAG: DsbA family protein [Alphaproteobacteria bacterium]|jgi:protein-disulfide isomerase|nr:DsbA family protein [Alphaproteobacteria bacterium]